VKLAPSRISPIFVPRIWGARTLAPLFDTPPGPDPIGEVWLTGESCAFATGPLAGQTLGEAWPTLAVEWVGTDTEKSPRIPLLVKFIFPDDKLSVQVHPNDEYAREHEAATGGIGKTEMWYAVAAQESAEVRLGLVPGVTRESFGRAIADSTVEECLKRVPVHAGDAFFVPAGTAHTIGPGMVLCEVQQYSDLTYRVFDYNRLQSDGKPRPLHLRQALEVMQFDEQAGGKVEPVRVEHGPLTETYFAACQYFATELWEFSERIAAVTSPKRFELLIPLSGHGYIEWSSESAPYRPAEIWMLPAALGAYQLTPRSETKVLRTYVPDLQEFAQQLADQRVEETVWSRLVHP
jgi:mannose-6-phosphate isomerase